MYALLQHIFGYVLTYLRTVLSGLGHVWLALYGYDASALASLEF